MEVAALRLGCEGHNSLSSDGLTGDAFSVELRHELDERRPSVRRQAYATRPRSLSRALLTLAIRLSLAACDRAVVGSIGGVRYAGSIASASAPSKARRPWRGPRAVGTVCFVCDRLAAGAQSCSRSSSTRRAASSSSCRRSCREQRSSPWRLYTGRWLKGLATRSRSGRAVVIAERPAAHRGMLESLYQYAIFAGTLGGADQRRRRRLGVLRLEVFALRVRSSVELLLCVCYLNEPVLPRSPPAARRRRGRCSRACARRTIAAELAGIGREKKRRAGASCSAARGTGRAAIAAALIIIVQAGSGCAVSTTREHDLRRRARRTRTPPPPRAPGRT